MNYRILMVLAAALALSGCKEDDDAAALRAKPEITDIGEIDSCNVKFVNRGYSRDSFFIARCPGAAITTRNYTERSGKTSVARRITVIEREFTPTDAQIKESALSKLTDEERAVLGVK